MCGGVGEGAGQWSGTNTVIPHPTLQTKRETHIQIKLINDHERRAQYTECTIGGHSATLIENNSNIYFYPFLFLITKRDKTGSIMGSWYSADHIAGNYIHTDITCNIEEPQHNSCLGTGAVSNRLLGVSNILLGPNPRPFLL